MRIQVCCEHWLRRDLWLFHFFLTLSHRSHCLIMSLNMSLYNSFSFSITYSPVIMSFPGKYSSNHISQWWGKRWLFLKEEEIFVTLITSKIYVFENCPHHSVIELRSIVPFAWWVSSSWQLRMCPSGSQKGDTTQASEVTLYSVQPWKANTRRFICFQDPVWSIAAILSMLLKN